MLVIRFGVADWDVWIKFAALWQNEREIFDVTQTEHGGLSLSAKVLGYAGLLPQFFAVFLALDGGLHGYVALIGGIAYAVLIFSFLGGVWWGQAAANGKAGAGTYLIAVVPSLIGLLLLMPIALGWARPMPILILLALLLLLSPLIDRWLGYANKSFMQLRWHLSIGLGVLTFALGVMARNTV